MKLILQLIILLTSSFTLHATEAKFYKIEGLNEDGKVCTVEISFGSNQHGDFPFIAYYGEVLSYIPLEVFQVQKFYEVKNGLREISFQGEHVWTFSKIKLLFDTKKRPVKAIAKLRPYLNPFWEKDICLLNSPRIDF